MKKAPWFSKEPGGFCTNRSPQKLRGPRESLRSKVSWGKGGMTEQNEKSPRPMAGGFLNGAESIQSGHPAKVCEAKFCGESEERRRDEETPLVLRGTKGVLHGP